MITHIRPHVGLPEIIAVAKVINSHWIGKGPLTKAFETRFANFIGVDSVLSLACASDALCLSMELLGVGPGDEVIVPSLHFVCAANAVLRRGAKVVFCDSDPITLNTSVKYVREKVTDRTRAVIVLHYGNPCNVQPIIDLGFPVVEDMAVGYGIKPKGDIALWSFDAMKLLTAGMGGAIWCGPMEQLAKSLISLGMTEQHGYASGRPQWWEFEVERPGRLSEMNDIAAAMGLCQLDRMKHDLPKRTAIGRYYSDNIPYVVHCEPVNPTFHFIQTPWRDGLALFLREHGIYTTYRYHLLSRAFKTGDDLPGAEYAADRTLLLPNHAGLSWKQVRYVTQKVNEFFERGHNA